MLTVEQRAQFETSGYCVVEDFKTSDEVASLKAAAADIIAAFDPAEHAVVFSTARDDTHADRFFLESGDKIRCFLEEAAVGPDGNLTCDKSLAVNKIGHALHDRHPAFDRFSRDSRLAGVARDVGLVDPRIWQSMYICKNPRVGGEVHWHQDATYFYTEPLSVVTFWFALDDASVDNGCLWVAASGPDTPLRERFEVIAGAPVSTVLDATPWPDLDAAVPLEVTAGTLVCFSGTLPHYSAPNRSARPRHAYTLHVTDARCRYPASNWIQRDDVRGFQTI